jgi:hypothetical protein
MIDFADGRMSFTPWLELTDGSTKPVRLEDQPDHVVETWASLLTGVKHPAWFSRLAHLVVLANRVVIGRDRVKLANRAIKGYLTLPDVWGSRPDAFENFRVGLGLARQFRLRQEVDEILERVATAADSELFVANPRPGVVLRLTKLLTDQTGSFDSPAKLSTLSEERVALWLDAAETANGVVRAEFLRRAAEHATASGYSSLRLVAMGRLQELMLSDLQLQGVRTGIILREEDISEFVKPVTSAASWSDALGAFAMMGPITGSYEENLAKVREYAGQFISYLLPRTAYGGAGLPRFTASSDEEREEYLPTSHETFALQMQAEIVAEALLRLPQHHGLPPLERLTAHFARNSIARSDLASILARCFTRWWLGDYEGAAFTATPIVEVLARNLLLSVDASIYRLQRNQSPGQYPGLGSLLKVPA